MDFAVPRGRRSPVAHNHPVTTRTRTAPFILSRRDALRLGGGVAAAAAFGGLSACGTKTEADNPVTLRMTWWGGDARTKAYQGVLAAFGRSHPGITVTADFSGYDGYFDKINANIAGGTAPDLLQMDTALVSEYAGRDVLRPLDEYLGDSLDLSAYPEALLAAGMVDGKLYGVPSGTGGVLVTYDATVLKAAKAAPPTADWSWPDLTAYATKLTKTLGGKVYGVSDGGGDDVGAFQIFLRQRRKDLFTADGALGYVEQDLTEWLTYWDEMRRRHAAPPGDITSAAHNDSAKNPLINGQVAMTFGSGLEISLPPLTDHELDFVPVPAGPAGSAEGQYLSGGVLLSSFARSERAKEAVEIISFLTNDEEAIKIMGLTRGIPPTDRAREIAGAQLAPAQQRALAATNVVAARVTAAEAKAPPSPPKGAGQVKELLFQNNLAVAFKRKTVPAAVKSFFAGATSALS
ncbi:ABC transporter substrate-binding protein [Actinoplanes sp. ATCC 53533]|nr:ABC transporter substrate-binding protein [Actinoplanes sp. ATCC 53533]